MGAFRFALNLKMNSVEFKKCLNILVVETFVFIKFIYSVGPLEGHVGTFIMKVSSNGIPCPDDRI